MQFANRIWLRITVAAVFLATSVGIPLTAHICAAMGTRALISMCTMPEPGRSRGDIPPATAATERKAEAVEMGAERDDPPAALPTHAESIMDDAAIPAGREPDGMSCCHDDAMAEQGAGSASEPEHSTSRAHSATDAAGASTAVNSEAAAAAHELPAAVTGPRDAATGTPAASQGSDGTTVGGSPMACCMDVDVSVQVRDAFITTSASTIDIHFAGMLPVVASPGCLGVGVPQPVFLAHSSPPIISSDILRSTVLLI